MPLCKMMFLAGENLWIPFYKAFLSVHKSSTLCFEVFECITHHYELKCTDFCFLHHSLIRVDRP